MNTIPLDALDLALAAALVLLNAGVSLALELGLAKKLLVAAVRAAVQLFLLGLIIGWIFQSEHPAAVLAVMIFMALYAGHEAVRRTTRRIPGIYGVGTGVMAASSVAVTLYALFAVLGTSPWYEPRYAIPILGMIAGNTLNGISLGLESAMAGFAENRREVELLLAHGATRREASREVVRRAVRVGLIPTINMMVAAGIVSIPGMMTGQILAGEDPQDAARYQMFILFLIAGGVAIGTFGVVLLVSRLVFDERDRLRVDRLRTVD